MAMTDGDRALVERLAAAAVASGQLGKWRKTYHVRLRSLTSREDRLVAELARVERAKEMSQLFLDLTARATTT